MFNQYRCIHKKFKFYILSVKREAIDFKFYPFCCTFSQTRKEVYPSLENLDGNLECLPLKVGNKTKILCYVSEDTGEIPKIVLQ